MSIVSTLMRGMLLAVPLALPASPAVGQDKGERPPSPPGAEKSGMTRTLEAGARLLQSSRPLRGFDIYLVGFHPMKDDPEQQMEAHHYCHQVNEDFAQCVLFDGNGSDAHMNGVEYIISEKLFESLPPHERPYWHPHNGEILSGQLVAPGIPRAAEQALMKQKMNSYGKTWHVWNTGHEGGRAHSLPLGEPKLAWSFSRDGEILPRLVQKRDRELRIDSARIRKHRAELREFARPQSGVDALQGRFKRPTTEIPGVVEKAGTTD